MAGNQPLHHVFPGRRLLRHVLPALRWNMAGKRQCKTMFLFLPLKKAGNQWLSHVFPDQF
jgi:hypothetical protein